MDAVLRCRGMTVWSGAEWLAVAELGGQVGEAVDRIYSASALNPGNFGDSSGDPRELKTSTWSGTTAGSDLRRSDGAW